MANVKERKRSLPKALSKCILRNNKLVVPNKALSNYDLVKYANCLNIPFFRGVFMKDKLPKHIWKNETGIVNLDNSSGPGSHWVCYKKLSDTIYYFDSFGDLPPPKELQKYFCCNKQVLYNNTAVQTYDSVICGHLCLEFLATSVSMI